VNLQYYIDLGWSVFPVKGPAYGKNYDDTKRPLLETWKPYQSRKPTSSEITQWQKEYPKMSIGAVAGPISGFFVVDIDGQEWIKHFPNADFGITWKSLSTHGCHYFYQWEDWMLSIPTTNAGVGGVEGFDIRGQGGYAIVPNENDRARTWELLPPETKLALLPEWIKAFLLKTATLYQGDKNWRLKAMQELGKGNRHDTFVRLAGSLINAKWKSAEILAVLQAMANECGFGEDIGALVEDVVRRYSPEGRLSLLQQKTRTAVSRMPVFSSSEMNRLKKTYPDLVHQTFLSADQFDKEAALWISSNLLWLGSSANKTLELWAENVAHLKNCAV